MANVWEQVGNVFESDCTVIMHQANAFGVMGSGIASQVKRDYPSAFQADLDFPIPVGSRARLGHFSYGWGLHNKRVIFNLYGQHRYGRQSKQTEEDKFRQALSGALAKLSDFRVSERSYKFPIKIGMPMFIGCGLAGGDWDVIYPIIEECADAYNFDIYLYALK